MISDLKRHYARLVASEIADRQESMDRAVANGDLSRAAMMLGEKTALEGSKTLLQRTIDEIDIDESELEDDEDEEEDTAKANRT